MKVVLLLILFLTSLQSEAGGKLPRDGTWITSGIGAYERTEVLKTGNSVDELESAIFKAYLSGLIDSQRQNNFMADMVGSGVIDVPKKKGTQLAVLNEIDKQFKILKILAPLQALPQELTIEQVIAVLKKYLSENPNKLAAPAPMIFTTALHQAFPGK